MESDEWCSLMRQFLLIGWEPTIVRDNFVSKLVEQTYEGNFRVSE